MMLYTLDFSFLYLFGHFYPDHFLQFPYRASVLFFNSLIGPLCFSSIPLSSLCAFLQFPYRASVLFFSCTVLVYTDHCQQSTDQICAYLLLHFLYLFGFFILITVSNLFTVTELVFCLFAYVLMFHHAQWLSGVQINGRSQACLFYW